MAVRSDGNADYLCPDGYAVTTHSFAEPGDYIVSVRRLAVEQLQAVSDICTVLKTQGAFYLLLKVHADMPAAELVERLVLEYGVGAIPGASFGLEDECCLGVSYGGLDGDSVAEGVGRLVKGLREPVDRSSGTS